MNKFYKVIWSNILQNWVVVSEISSFIKKKSCCLCSGLILVSPFSLGADITCFYSVCDANGNIMGFYAGTPDFSVIPVLNRLPMYPGQ
ncbi:ESPR domain-containing protein [Escherichia coli]